MLYEKETLILEKITTTLLSNESEKDQIKRSMNVRVWWSREEKEEEEKKVRVHRKHVTFVTWNITERKTVSIDKSD